MAKRCKGFNSKCFLFTYLIIVGFLLVLWMNKLPLMHEDQREIPADLQDYIRSPSLPLPEFSLVTISKLALTNDWFTDKWSFVIFTHGACLPECEPILTTMTGLRSGLANNDVQFLVVGINSQHEDVVHLSDFLNMQGLAATAATGSSETIDLLARSFIALFLQTDYSDGSYQIEQEFHLFLVDPKGRVYATFKPPYSSDSIKAQFFKLRYFYGRSE